MSGTKLIPALGGSANEVPLDPPTVAPRGATEALLDVLASTTGIRPGNVRPPRPKIKRQPFRPGQKVLLKNVVPDEDDVAVTGLRFEEDEVAVAMAGADLAWSPDVPALVRKTLFEGKRYLTQPHDVVMGHWRTLSLVNRGVTFVEPSFRQLTSLTSLSLSANLLVDVGVVETRRHAKAASRSKRAGDTRSLASTSPAPSPRRGRSRHSSSVRGSPTSFGSDARGRSRSRNPPGTSRAGSAMASDDGGAPHVPLPGDESCLPSSLEILSLNGNYIATVPATLAHLTNLKHLGLAFNQLHAPDSLRDAGLTGLISLDLSYNALTDLPDTTFALASLPQLSHLVMIGNPFVLLAGYRAHTLATLRRLAVLDEVEVRDNERAEVDTLAASLPLSNTVTIAVRLRGLCNLPPPSPEAVWAASGGAMAGQGDPSDVEAALGAVEAYAEASASAAASNGAGGGGAASWSGGPASAPFLAGANASLPGGVSPELLVPPTEVYRYRVEFSFGEAQPVVLATDGVRFVHPAAAPVPDGAATPRDDEPFHRGDGGGDGVSLAGDDDLRTATLRKGGVAKLAVANVGGEHQAGGHGSHGSHGRHHRHNSHHQKAANHRSHAAVAGARGAGSVSGGGDGHGSDELATQGSRLAAAGVTQYSPLDYERRVEIPLSRALRDALVHGVTFSLVQTTYRMSAGPEEPLSASMTGLSSSGDFVDARHRALGRSRASGAGSGSGGGGSGGGGSKKARRSGATPRTRVSSQHGGGDPNASSGGGKSKDRKRGNRAPVFDPDMLEEVASTEIATFTLKMQALLDRSATSVQRVLARDEPEHNPYYRLTYVGPEPGDVSGDDAAGEPEAAGSTSDEEVTDPGTESLSAMISNDGGDGGGRDRSHGSGGRSETSPRGHQPHHHESGTGSSPRRNRHHTHHHHQHRQHGRQRTSARRKSTSNSAYTRDDEQPIRSDADNDDDRRDDDGLAESSGDFDRDGSRRRGGTSRDGRKRQQRQPRMGRRGSHHGGAKPTNVPNIDLRRLRGPAGETKGSGGRRRGSHLSIDDDGGPDERAAAPAVDQDAPEEKPPPSFELSVPEQDFSAVRLDVSARLVHRAPGLRSSVSTTHHLMRKGSNLGDITDLLSASSGDLGKGGKGGKGSAGASASGGRHSRSRKVSSSGGAAAVIERSRAGSRAGGRRPPSGGSRRKDRLDRVGSRAKRRR